MNSFTQLYRAELYKMTRKKALVKLGIALVVLLVLGIGFSLLVSSLASDIFQTPDFESNEQAIAYYENALAAVPSNASPLVQAQVASMKAQLEKYRYLQENRLQAYQVSDFLGASSNDVVSVVNMSMAFVILALAIYGIVAVSDQTQGEYAKGIMRMELIRPRNRHAVLAAKYLCVLTVVMIGFTVCFLVSSIAAAIQFAGKSVKPILLITSDMGCAAINQPTALLLLFVGQLPTLFGVVFLSLLISTTAKSKRSVVAIPVLLYVVVPAIEEFLCSKYTGYVGYAGLFNNLGWLNALTASGTPCAGMNVFGMIAISTIWMAVMLAASHYVFAKRDMT